MFLYNYSINIKNLTSDTNIKSLARHIVSQTSLINPTRLPEVEQLLVYLLSRKKNKKGFEGAGMDNDFKMIVAILNYRGRHLISCLW